MFTNCVSLFLKALLVLARSRVYYTEVGISPTRHLTTTSNHREFHRQFRGLRDLLTENIFPPVTGVKTPVSCFLSADEKGFPQAFIWHVPSLKTLGFHTSRIYYELPDLFAITITITIAIAVTS